MNKSRSSHDKSREVMNKLHTSWELAEALKDLKTTILGGWWVGVWFNSVVRLRLSQPPASAWAWAWAELGNSGAILVRMFYSPFANFKEYLKKFHSEQA